MCVYTATGRTGADSLRVTVLFSTMSLTAVRNSKEPASITDARYALDGFFNHLKVDFIKNSL